MLTIIWDIDDVLNNLMRSWFYQGWLPHHPDCQLEYNDITENPPDKLLKTSKEEYLESLDAFRLSKNAMLMQPNPNILQWFNNYGHKCMHIALTNRPLKTVPPLAGWIFSYFGDWIRTFSFIPPSRNNDSPPRYFQTKKDYLLWLGNADIFIDDNLDNIIDAESIGMKTILMPQPWNNSKLTINETLILLLDIISNLGKSKNNTK